MHDGIVYRAAHEQKAERDSNCSKKAADGKKAKVDQHEDHLGLVEPANQY